jgi:UDP-glucose 4-epimerase
LPLVLEVPAGKRASVKIFGTDYDTPDGTCIRDYVHVSDLASVHILALEHMIANNYSTSFNLGNGKGYSVKEIMQDVLQAILFLQLLRNAGKVMLQFSSQVVRRLRKF